METRLENIHTKSYEIFTKVWKQYTYTYTFCQIDQFSVSKETRIKDKKKSRIHIWTRIRKRFEKLNPHHEKRSYFGNYNYKINPPYCTQCTRTLLLFDLSLFSYQIEGEKPTLCCQALSAVDEVLMLTPLSHDLPPWPGGGGGGGGGAYIHYRLRT